jgi:Tol biopolymer transport system component
MSIEGSATDHLAIDAPGTPHVPGSWSPDGQALLFTKLVANGVWEIRAFSRTGGERNERGEEQVYVERYRGAAVRYPISTNGGTSPAWAPSGREVFYITPAPEGRIRMMAADVTLSPAFTTGIPRELFEGRYAVGSPHRHYDVSRDGRFLMLQEPLVTPPPPVTQMVVVLNWFEELKRLAPRDR